MTNITEGSGVLALAADLATQKDIYFLAAVRFIGCTITSHETGMMSMGDDQGFAVATMLGDWADRADLKRYLDQYIAHEAASEDRDKAIVHVCDIPPGRQPRRLSRKNRRTSSRPNHIPAPRRISA